MNVAQKAQCRIDIRPAASRFHTRLHWLDAHHSFSFGHHYDSANTHHGLLLVANDDTVSPGGGFGMHGHEDMEIVTWILEGELEHRDSMGTHGRIPRGQAQAMSAGRGVMHSEINPSSEKSVRLCQMWVPPAKRGLEPRYEQRDFTEALASGGLVAVASGAGAAGAMLIQNPAATLWVARVPAGSSVELPGSAFGHLFIAEGAGSLARPEGGAESLTRGDAARLTAAPALTLSAGADGAEVLFWQMDADLKG